MLSRVTERPKGARLCPTPLPSLGSCGLVLLLFFFVLLTACEQGSSQTTGSQPTATPIVARDVYGTTIVFPTTAPQRIVSLTPSMSEILGALHLEGRVVAVDYYTTYPADIASLSKISDANGKYNVEQIVALKPDLLLGDGALTKTYDVQLKNLGLRVVDLASTSLPQILQKILLVGRLTFTEDTAHTVVNQMQQQMSAVKSMVAGTTAPKVLLEVDDSTSGKPYVFGDGSFGDELLQGANGVNIFHDNSSNGGYPQVTDEAIIVANPQFVILTEDPAYGGNPALVYKRPNWGGIDALKLHHVYHINANIMQHPSQRLINGLLCLAQLIHPDKFSGPLPGYCSGTV
jgi:ABC-type Fe3+-hydroxamate transport system substrate-binding protein